jgi:hypothetical protein
MKFNIVSKRIDLVNYSTEEICRDLIENKRFPLQVYSPCNTKTNKSIKEKPEMLD